MKRRIFQSLMTGIEILGRVFKPHRNKRRWIHVTLIYLFAMVFLGMSTLSVAVFCFSYPIKMLSPDRHGPLLIVDRHGLLLRSMPSRDGRPGREQWVPLERISSHALLTLLASEDQGFYDHPGVDPWGIVRAAALNLWPGLGRYGGSTITMQLMRMVHSAGQRRSLANKIKEAVLALRLERVMDKHAILEQYLNRVYFGHGAYGIEAAARLYFDKPAASLSVGEASLLMIIVRGPSFYDPVRQLDRALKRRDHVFDLLIKQGRLNRDEAKRARAQVVKPGLHLPFNRAQHFVDWVLSTLPPTVKRRGGVVSTTLDFHLQARMEKEVAAHVKELENVRLTQAGLLILNSQSQEVLAMVGSAGYRQGKDGQINITTWKRHPGSALKPFVYALAIEEGDSPASIAFDIHHLPTSRYRVHQLAQKEHGPVRYREALAGSYNLSAVHVLEKVGIGRLMTTLKQGGIADLPGKPKEYGLRLALGSAKVRLIDLAAGYGFLVRGGRVIPAKGVLHLRYADGSLWFPPKHQERRLFSEQVSWLVMDMLSDPEARRPMFGQELPVDLPYRVAVKTGTARGFADTLAIGVTNELTVAAWAGNFDGKPNYGALAMRAAAPLVRAGLFIASEGKTLTLPARPEGIIEAEVCPLSGLRAGPNCPHRKLEYFLEGHVPIQKCSWHIRQGERISVAYPNEISDWARRQRAAGGRAL